MSSKVIVILLGIGCWIALCSSSNSSNVQWYRTAQYTDDRMTKQQDVNFGDNFDLDVVVEIKR